MPIYDTIIRHGTVVLQDGLQAADLAISEGVIVALEPELAGEAHEQIDATGQILFPGGIDPHVHCNEPGRTEWEGFASATAALAVGGVTTVIDMPLNAHPPTCDRASFDQKLAAAQQHAVIDFALWGGLVPGNLEELAELAACGVVGFKAFMSNSGIEDFSAADDLTLYEGMQRAAQLGLPVAVHAESDQITTMLAARARRAGRTGIRDYLASRPIVAEIEAIGRAITFAEATGCALHIVHVSSGRGVALVAEAAARGVDVTCETCPHYLVLTEDDVERIGALAKCAPPLRHASECNALWEQIRSGELPMVASDHSPAPAHMKESADFFAIWGGISGCQSTLALLLSAGYHECDIPLTTLASITASGAAQRFGLGPAKGQIAPGCAADLAIIDLNLQWTLHAEQLLYRHQHSPYVGMQLHGQVVRTLARGVTIAHHGIITARHGRGQLLRPAR